MLRMTLVISAALLVSPGAWADDTTKPPRRPRPETQNPPDAVRVFEQIDRNKDGFLDKDEAPERLRDRFEQLDENKDGKLSRDEIRKVLDRFAARPGSTPTPGTSPLPPSDVLFRVLDANGDGKLVSEELQAAARVLARFDRNGDGAIDPKELAEGSRAAAPPPAEAASRIKAMLERLDLDKDGKLSKEEARGPLADNFDRVDQNRDGFIDRSEARQALERLGQGNPPAPGDNAQRLREMFQRLDANNDGKISKDEARGPLAEGFDRVDSNGDGVVDQAEARAALERLARIAPPSDRPRPSENRRPSASFEDLDKDVDGRLSRDEVKGSPLAEKFDNLDKNKDGKLDPKEFAGDSKN